ncbi:YciI family protein [Cognatilysobacter lacus]|uniref:YciI family protein n=1 Tax=Cognatilysobacter lacus TaxID=1643323 RepID=A0A5D8Z553_9GAMM|nr:YciI family protein [Lysobacter lacus]TZF90125.1 YciI family protein [Lysobacter lacus]
MRVLVIVKATAASEAGVMPGTELIEAMDRFNQELLQAGVLLAAEGLKPSSSGSRVRFSGTSRSVVDGPFAEAHELVAGFWLWQVRSMDEAIEWARRCPNPHADGGELEIRPVFEADDFADAMTPAQRESEARKRAQLADN